MKIATFLTRRCVSQYFNLRDREWESSENVLVRSFVFSAHRILWFSEVKVLKHTPTWKSQHFLHVAGVCLSTLTEAASYVCSKMWFFVFFGIHTATLALQCLILRVLLRKNTLLTTFPRRESKVFTFWKDRNLDSSKSLKSGEKKVKQIKLFCSFLTNFEGRKCFKKVKTL